MDAAAAGLRILPVPGIPEIRPGENLAERIIAAVRGAGIAAGAGDIFVVAQKIVSKAEGRIVQLDAVEPSRRAREWAEEWGKDARQVETILRESRRVVRMERGILITETRHGFVCANSGVDASNCAPGTVTLLPEDPDGSAERLRTALEEAFGGGIGVIISDTFGRAWRDGQTNVALGVAGFAPLEDYRGRKDTAGRTLQSTVIAIADELAAAAELVMGKTRGVPVAVVQGYSGRGGKGNGRELIRPAELDLFR